MIATSTFSAAGRCSRTGAIGAVVTSSSPAVGARCLHIAPDTGVVLTQNVTDPRLADIGLACLKNGYHPDDAMRAMTAATPYAGYRQLAVLDARGNTSVYSGEKSLGIYNHFRAPNIACIGNLLSDASIPEAMAQHFMENGHLPLAERLLSTIATGFEMGGEMDDERSIALKVYRQGVSFAYVDLRVDDSDDPLGDMTKLWEVYGPQADAYVTRALHPDQAPSFGVRGDE